MIKPQHQNYRICYNNIDPAVAQKVYELSKYCDCTTCKDRLLRREPTNWVSATTKDISKVDDVAEFLKSWVCNEKKYVGPVFIKF